MLKKIKTINNERGDIVPALPIMFLLLIVLAAVVVLYQGIISGDVVLKESNAIAVKGAVAQFKINGGDKNNEPGNGQDNDQPGSGPPGSGPPTDNPGNGPPGSDNSDKTSNVHIDIEKARLKYEEMLKKNLDLKNNLEPRNTSNYSEDPEYSLVIYNGKGSPSGAVYEYKDGDLDKKELHDKGFPKVFSPAEGIKVRLESPGAVSLLRAKPIGRDVEYKRWAGAQVVERDNGTYSAVLVKALD